jgi:uncharacterized membrane protein
VYSPALSGGAAFYSSAIADNGVVVGYVQALDTHPQAAIWRPGGPFTLLGTGGDSYSEARAVTADGAVVGPTAEPLSRVFVWRAATGMVDIGAPEGERSLQYQAVTDQGHIVVTGADQVSTYLWRDGTFLEIERDPDLRFRGINNLDQLAFDTASRNARDTRVSPTSRAHVWSGGTMIDLDATVGGDATSTAEAINDRGQIVGTDGDGTPDGPRRAVIWTVPSVPTA